MTGATGFIGRPLCSKLEASGFSVRAAIWRNDASVSLPIGIDSTIIDSIGPDMVWDKALQGIDTVIHLAARVHIMDENDGDPLAAYRSVNVAGTQKLARSAVAAGVKRLVFLSSVKVNGEETPIPYREDAPPAPQDPYGVSKLEAELVLGEISAESGLEVVVIRPPLVYGPGVKANFYKLFHTVARGIPLPLASVKNSRSMVYLGNLLDAIVLCAKHPRAAGKTFFVSDREDVSTPELIRRLAFALGRQVCLLGIPAGLMRLIGKLSGKTTAVDRLLGSLTVDTSRIRAELGWEPPFTMSEGLKVTADWYKKLLDEHYSVFLMKRALDILLSLGALAILALPMLLLAVLVRLTSQGPALYYSNRVGRDNLIFKMPKFRTMRADTPPMATHLMAEPERFLTPIGGFLRKTSLDELPQFFSILSGEMSFVGPRPALFNQKDLIALRTAKGIHHITPGLTGWAQVNGRDDLPIPVKVDYDEYYLTHRSFSFDFKIITMTAVQALTGKGVSH